MIHSDNFFLAEQDFLFRGLASPSGPFYFSILLYALKRLRVNQPHIFTNDPGTASHIIGSERSLKEYWDFPARKVVFLENVPTLPDRLLDREDVSLISFNSDPMENRFKSAQVVKKKYAPYHFDDLPDFPSETEARYNMFTVSVFGEHLMDCEEVVDYWISKPEMNGVLYLFFYRRTLFNDDERIQAKIDKFNLVNSNRLIRTINVVTVDRTVIYRALQSSVFSLFLDPTYVYPYWAARLKCYPVVLPYDNFSTYVPHVGARSRFVETVQYFWEHPQVLADLISKLGGLQFPKFEFANVLGGIET